MTTAYKYHSKRSRNAYAAALAHKRRRINIFITVVFVLANLLLAIIFWPMLKDHLDKIKSGEREAIFTIRGESK